MSQTQTSQIRLTEAEWTVMECLWDKSPRTGRETTELLAAQTGWNRSTTLTLLRRLEEKGAVTSAAEGTIKQFRPLVCREDAVLQETESFLARLYHGSLSRMVGACTRRQDLPPEELEELRHILDELEERRA